jgi:alpha-L-fucosidase
MSKEKTGSTSDVGTQHAQIGVAKHQASSRTNHPDAQWFPDAGLGMFFHWGISSVFGIGDLSWSMINDDGFRQRQLDHYGYAALQARMSPEKYWSQANLFNPDRYEPRKWLEAAKRTGVKYAVLTTKHHDGYALWPSKFGEFSTRTHLGGRDLVGDYVEACRETGIKVGFYYSPPDWFFNRHRMSFNGDGKIPLGVKHEPIERPVFSQENQAEWLKGYQTFIRGQVEELLTRYGKIDILWFDGEGSDAITLERIRELQPGILINSRAHGTGDFETPECSFPAERPKGWWEMCHIWNDGAWAYLSHEIYKTTGWMLTEYVKCRAWGGNFLINVGPNAHGELPEAAYQRLSELERWMQHSGTALIGTTSGEWPAGCNVPMTRKGNTLYLLPSFAFEGEIEVKGIQRPKSVKRLRDGGPMEFQYEKDMLKIKPPNDERTVLVDAIEVIL